MKIRFCPACGSRKVRYVVEDDVVKIDGHRVVIPELKRLRCAKCGGNFYDREAGRAIDRAMLNNPHFLAARQRALQRSEPKRKAA